MLSLSPRLTLSPTEVVAAETADTVIKSAASPAHRMTMLLMVSPPSFVMDSAQFHRVTVSRKSQDIFLIFIFDIK
jgi:hypothetical protein